MRVAAVTKLTQHAGYRGLVANISTPLHWLHVLVVNRMIQGDVI